MKIIPNTPHGWAWWVEQVKKLDNSSFRHYDLLSDDERILHSWQNTTTICGQLEINC